jgi:alkanesulfonate monooxygenase SsuD/methylene tetrahydromethanopterin reductase-like flavin-dependent oxidoreductase (luciferase family)
MKFGIDIAQQRVEFDEVIDRARFSEEVGFYGAWGFDHFVPMYGDGPGNCFEGMTTLAALAMTTQRIRLGLLVTGATYRHPSVFAAQAVTIDHASRGRLDVALGAAWFESEHLQLGIDFPTTARRFDRLEDTLEIVTRLFTGEIVSYKGHSLSLDQARMRPTPLQQPRPPIWVGGSGRRRTMPLAARFADVWHSGASEQFVELSAELDRLAETFGRDPRSIMRASSLSLSEPWDLIRRNIDRAQQRGIGYLICGWPGEGPSHVQEFAERIFPEFQG